VHTPSAMNSTTAQRRASEWEDGSIASWIVDPGERGQW
jgi:hypothetical protein